MYDRIQDHAGWKVLLAPHPNGAKGRGGQNLKANVISAFVEGPAAEGSSPLVWESKYYADLVHFLRSAWDSAGGEKSKFTTHVTAHLGKMCKGIREEIKTVLTDYFEGIATDAADKAAALGGAGAGAASGGAASGGASDGDGGTAAPGAAAAADPGADDT